MLLCLLVWMSSWKARGDPMCQRSTFRSEGGDEHTRVFADMVSFRDSGSSEWTDLSDCWDSSVPTARPETGDSFAFGNT